MTTGPVGILLAAGQSRRFGSNKLLHALDDGTPMALASLRCMRAVLPVIAVVEDRRSDLARVLSGAGAILVANPDAQAGMGTSVARGVAACPAARGWVVGLADMPFVPESAVRAVAGALVRGADLAAPVYRGERGHPVGFSGRHGPALMALYGDRGARAVLERNRATLELLAGPWPGVVKDIDLPCVDQVS